MKQVFKANESLRRLLCALLVAIMVFGMIPMAAPKAEAVSGDQTLYFKPCDLWGSDSNAKIRYAAYFFIKDTDTNTWASMTGPDSNGVYSCTVPSGNYNYVIFCRMNGNNSTNSWDNKHNQTADIPLSSDKNYFTMNNQWDGASGNWSTYSSGGGSSESSTPSGTDTIAYLAGDMTNWADGKLAMLGSGNVGSVTVKLEEGNYGFKIILADGSTWRGNGGTIDDSGELTIGDNNSGDCTLKASGGTYTFTYDTSAKKVTVTHTGGTTDDTKLFVNTTFYDYRSDHELGGQPLSNRNWFNVCYDSWYIFRNLNSALSGYYKDNNVKVPIYMGHFQPTWDDLNYGITYHQFVAEDNNRNLYGFEGWKASGNSNSDNTHQKWFMSVNNSLLDISPETWELQQLTRVYSAAWGIVAPTLQGESKQLMAATTSGTVEHPLFNETFLTTKYNNSQPYANIYKDVQFPFTKSELNGDGIEYWVFDSEKTTLKMNSNFTALEKVSNPGDGFKNRQSDGSIAGNGKFGFFPFNTGSETYANQYNYGFGMRLDLEFDLTYDGKLPDEYGQRHPMIFKFSGDDDVWVFIDGQLVLDIGGSHGKVTGEINFAEGYATVSDVKTSLGDTSPDDAKSNIDGYQTNFTLDNTNNGHHTLTMFYMERGMWESNMSISFNFVPKSALDAETTTVKVEKKWDADNRPTDIDVQLQRRLEGGAWEAVGENVALQGATGWTHTFADVEKFADFARTQKYEFRVVELDDDGTVLEAGQSNYLGHIVTYGEMYGDEATGLKQTITNIKPDKSVIVIDFGLPVDVTIDTKIDSYTGTLFGIGDASKLPIAQSKDFAHTDLILMQGIPYYTDHGYATLNGTKIRYTPTDMEMNKAELIGYALKYTSNGSDRYYYSTLTVIPAANIYYEDSFLEFANADETVLSTDNDYGKWQTAGTTISNGFQEEDRPGAAATDALKAIDKDNVYGYDPVYGECREYSLGSARKVTVNTATGNKNVAPSATFTFTGTGFDVVSLTDSDCGAIMVEVVNAATGTKERSYIVNNYYGMIYNETTGQWDVLDENDSRKDSYHLYQVPVMKVTDLAYGTYNVTIKAAYLSYMDMDHVGEYTIWLDAIRIYNPAQNDTTSNDAYEKDNENNAILTTVKKLLLSPDGFTAGSSATGIIYVEGKSDVDGKTDVSIQHYANQGPNNETYLKNGNGIAFKLRYQGASAPSINVHIGAKLATGSTATMNYNGKSKTLTTATNMFYDLGSLTWTSNNGVWESNSIVISCSTSDSSAILSLTDLKVTGADAANVGSLISGGALTVTSDEEVFNEAQKYMGAAVEAETVTLEGKNFSLSFEDEILVNYYYSVSDLSNVTEHGMLVFNTNPGTADIDNADQKYDAPAYVESDGLYACTTSGIAASEMGDDRYYCAYAKLSDGTIVYSDLNQYSPKQYAMSRLEKSENENLKALCVAMLNYGAAAQQYFGYKTEDLMNAALTDAQKALVGEYNADLFNGTVAADPEKIDSNFTATETGFKSIGATVSFEGAFAMNFYFKLDREATDVQFCYWTKEAYENADMLSDSNCTDSFSMTADENGFFFAPITGIAAKSLDDTFYVAATYTVDGETFCSGVIAYSLSTYCMKQANSSMSDLAQSTAMYGYYAECYFGVSSEERI